VMSIEGAPDCGICGAHGDYCHLTTASGIEIDCRNLQLKNPDDFAFNIGLAGELRSGCEAQHDESMNPVFKSARTDHAPKTREELSDRIDQQLDEHAADYERLASGDLHAENQALRAQLDALRDELARERVLSEYLTGAYQRAQDRVDAECCCTGGKYPAIPDSSLASSRRSRGAQS
jgi:hypothetical protein